MDGRCRAIAAAAALTGAVLVVACGDPEVSTYRSDPEALETPTSTPYFGTPTPVPTATRPVAPSVPPTVTSTLIPPDPRFVTPEPTAVPVTAGPRWPIASDIKLDATGKYYAEVDGCRWDEYGRFPKPLNPAETEVGMQSPCFPSEGLRYNLSTGEVTYFAT